MHGVNLDQLGRRNPDHYGGLNFDRLEQRDRRVRRVSSASTRASSRRTPRASSSSTCTGSEDMRRRHHRQSRRLDPLLVRDPRRARDRGAAAVEVHLSDVDAREEFRRVSVVRDLCIATVSGQGVDGYREALTRLKEELQA